MRICWRLTSGAVALASLAAQGCSPDLKGGVNVDPGASIVSVTLYPSNVTISQGNRIQFGSYARTVAGDSVIPLLDWVATGGVLGPDGEYTGTQPGTFRVAGLTHQAPHIGDTVTVVVTPLITVDSVVVSPSLITLQPGATQTFAAAEYRNDGSVIAPAVTWSATGGTISGAGLYTAGTTTGSYRVDALEAGTGQLLDTARVVIAAAAATLQRVEVTPATGAIASGGTIQFTARGRYSDGSLLPIAATWSAGSGSITAGGLYTAGQAAGTFSVIGRNTASGFADTSQVTVTGSLASLDLTPHTIALNYGAPQQYTVFGRQTDGTIVSVAVTFSATGGSITAGGYYVAGQTAGTYRVVARETSSGIADTSTVTVQAPPPTIVDLDLLPNSVSILTGGTKQFTAQDVWSNGTTSPSTSVTYLASAGTITASGIYTAPQSAGTYRVIGVGTSGFRDTTSVVVSAPATLARIVIAPASVTVAAGGVVPFVATGRLSDGSTTNVSVTWDESGGGVINSNGLFTAGSVPGQYKIFAQVVGGTLRDTADVFVSSTPPTPSNEPAGYVPFAIHRLDEIPVFGRAVGGVLGSWWAYPQGNNNLTLANDAGAPQSPDSVIRTRFRAGMTGGVAPVNWGGWDIAGSGTAGEKSRIYFSMWIKVEGTDFESHPTNTKMGFIGFGAGQASGMSQGFFRIMGAGGSTTTIASSFPMSFVTQSVMGPEYPGPGGNLHSTNVLPSARFTVGVWHHWEAVLESNTFNGSSWNADGVFKWWQDGVLIAHHRNMVYKSTGYTHGFSDWKWNPTWGGTGFTKSRDDYMLIDHVYISGLP